MLAIQKISHMQMEIRIGYMLQNCKMQKTQNNEEKKIVNIYRKNNN